MTVATTIIGVAFGGWMNDKLGRKRSILVPDAAFFLGALVMVVALVPLVIIMVRVLVGLGVGMASMTAPLYIYEASPTKIRGALVTMEVDLINRLFGRLGQVTRSNFGRMDRWERWVLNLYRFPQQEAEKVKASDAGFGF
ncbi:hypothetical protein ACSQ67_026020 [Phaseolus vulgaris]